MVIAMDIDLKGIVEGIIEDINLKDIGLELNLGTILKDIHGVIMAFNLGDIVMDIIKDIAMGITKGTIKDITKGIVMDGLIINVYHDAYPCLFYLSYPYFYHLYPFFHRYISYMAFLISI